MRSKILLAVGILVGAIGIGVGIAYLAGGGSSPLPSSPASGSTPTARTGGAGPTDLGDGPTSQNSQPVAPMADTQAMVPIQSNITAQVSTNPANLNTNWEDTVDEIVGSDDADTNKVKQLFALFPNLPPDGQEEVAQHLSNLVEDDAYGPLGDLLKNANLPQGVLDELMSDVLNRPNTIKLPTLLDVAQDSSNPEHDEAKDLLELYLGDDPSTNNWGNAGQMVTNWLQQNPD